MIDAIQFRDVPLIEVTVLLASTVYVLANFLADLGALLFIPKLRSGSR
jgi:ABC-type dipeptide/oligopeptide/nickel transport system permease component